MTPKDPRNGRAPSPGASRVSRLARGTRYGRTVLWPGTDVEVHIRPLSCAQVQECYAGANERFRDQLDNLPSSGLFVDPFQDELSIQILARACRVPERPEELFFPTPDDLRDNVTPQERDAMMGVYADVANGIDPELHELEPAVLEAILEAIKKKDETRLSSFGAPTLVTFLLTMGNQPSSSHTGS